MLRQFCDPPKQVRHRQSGRVCEGKPAVERAELRARQILVDAIGIRRSAHHEHLPEIRVQVDRDVDRALHVQREHHARRLRSRARTPRGVHDRCAWKQLVSIPVHEIDHGVRGRDDHVEGLTGVLPPEEVTNRRLVVGLGKPRDIQVFGVVIELSGQTVVENGANGAVNVDRHRRPPLQGDEHQHGFLRSRCRRDRAKHSQDCARGHQRGKCPGSRHSSTRCLLGCGSANESPIRPSSTAEPVRDARSGPVDDGC